MNASRKKLAKSKVFNAWRFKNHIVQSGTLKAINSKVADKFLSTITAWDFKQAWEMLGVSEKLADCFIQPDVFRCVFQVFRTMFLTVEPQELLRSKLMLELGMMALFGLSFLKDIAEKYNPNRFAVASRTLGYISVCASTLALVIEGQKPGNSYKLKENVGTKGGLFLIVEQLRKVLLGAVQSIGNQGDRVTSATLSTISDLTSTKRNNAQNDVLMESLVQFYNNDIQGEEELRKMFDSKVKTRERFGMLRMTFCVLAKAAAESANKFYPIQVLKYMVPDGNIETYSMVRQETNDDMTQNLINVVINYIHILTEGRIPSSPSIQIVATNRVHQTKDNAEKTLKMISEEDIHPLSMELNQYVQVKRKNESSYDNLNKSNWNWIILDKRESGLQSDVKDFFDLIGATLSGSKVGGVAMYMKEFDKEVQTKKFSSAP